MNDISFYLPRIDRTFANLDERVFARQYLKHKLNGDRMPIPNRYLTLGTAKMIKQTVEKMLEPKKEQI